VINTLHENDFAAWYRLSAPVEDISIHDFEVEDECSLEDLFSDEWPESLEDAENLMEAVV